MSKINQNKTPFVDALKEYIDRDVVPFDVPGHHWGNAKNVLKDFLGDTVYKADVNAPEGLDNLAHPHEVLLDSYKLLEEATGADHAFFLINGTTSGIIALIMSVCKNGDKIILPRNVHKSIINALVLSGATPVYVMPVVDSSLGIANQPSINDYKKAILKHPSAKAIFIINPTYFGATLDIKNLVKFAHEHGVAVIVDEAHGCHFYFNKKGPTPAMAAGADGSAASFHKTCGSLTQSSVLLLKNGLIDKNLVQKSLNILNTTSPSTLLMASLDSARSYMATEGQEALDNTIYLANYAREEISKIPGFLPRGKSHFIKHGAYDFDETKLVIEIDHLDISGFDVYYELDKHNIQIELAETYALLCIFAIGTKKEHVDALINALRDISNKHYVSDANYTKQKLIMESPYQLIKPRQAIQAPGIKKRLEDAAFEICKEQIMIYPPGIPLIVPGEVFTPEIITKIKHYYETGVTVLSDFDDGTVNVVDKKKWKYISYYKKHLDNYIENKVTNPSDDGFYMPFEGKKHAGTIILLPFRKDTWRLGGAPAREVFKQIIFSIAKYETVYVGIHPSIYSKVIATYEGIENIKPFKIKYNDSWARDNTPIFVLNNKGQVRTVDFRFNAWGGEVDGLYSNYDDDDKLSSLLSKKFKLPSYYLNDFILEGGSIHVDGEGTCLVTEACLLSEGRNPTYDKNEIEEMLKQYLNVDKVIWIPNGIYLDETNEHIDNMACFVRPGEVALAWTDDENDPQYLNCQSAYKILSEAKDAKNRKLKIYKISLPEPQYMSEKEAKQIGKSHFNPKERPADSRLAASYINFYMGKEFIIMPAFGVPEDEIAYREIKAIFPDKEIIQINTREVLLGGGNIHCITMQIPEKE